MDVADLPRGGYDRLIDELPSKQLGTLDALTYRRMLEHLKPRGLLGLTARSARLLGVKPSLEAALRRAVARHAEP